VLWWAAAHSPCTRRTQQLTRSRSTHPFLFVSSRSPLRVRGPGTVESQPLVEFGASELLRHDEPCAHKGDRVVGAGVGAEHAARDRRRAHGRGQGYWQAHQARHWRPRAPHPKGTTNNRGRLRETRSAPCRPTNSTGRGRGSRPRALYPCRPTNSTCTTTEKTSPRGGLASSPSSTRTTSGSTGTMGLGAGTTSGATADTNSSRGNTASARRCAVPRARASRICPGRREPRAAR